jgi:hypothetical protein
MTKLAWDVAGERVYETGVDHGVLYLPDASGAYVKAVAWNGLVSVSESPSGAEANPQYADNMKYLNLISAEEFGATIEAFTYPKEFGICDGSAEIANGVAIGQQRRSNFGLAYRTKIGNDLVATDYGYKLHLIYGALAAPTEKAYSTVNESPEALTFSWELTTTAVDVPGFKPSASLVIDSTKVDKVKLAALEDILFGTGAIDGRLPLPTEIIALFSNAVATGVTADAPTYVPATKTVTIPNIAGVEYQVDGKKVTGSFVITKDTTVTARTLNGFSFNANSDDDWVYKF